eukprot:450023-Pelagomonas_calceolata.AAC.2
MFNGSANHIVPDDKDCWGTWSNCKGIGKTRTDSCVNHIFGLTVGGLGGIEVFKPFPQVTSHTLDLVLPVLIHGELDSKAKEWLIRW